MLVPADPAVGIDGELVVLSAGFAVVWWGGGGRVVVGGGWGQGWQGEGLRRGRSVLVEVLLYELEGVGGGRW